MESDSCYHRSCLHQRAWINLPSRYDGIVLFKTELLCIWYGLSDGEVEEQVKDGLSLGRFVGLGPEDSAPDGTTVCRFRNTLVEAGLPEGPPVYADKGYDSTEDKGVPARMRLRSRIVHKAAGGRKITERERRVNVAISRIRYKVERTFGSLRRWFCGGVARYVGLAKTHARHIMEAIAHYLYRSPGIIVANSLK